MDPKDVRILLVDDFEMVRILLAQSLRKLGFTRIDEAEDGRPALAMINEASAAGAPYSIVFCDWVMPEVTGIEVVKECRATEGLKDLCIIMVTAEAEQESVVNAIALGTSDYIVKPFSPQTLEKKIARIMSRFVSDAA